MHAWALVWKRQSDPRELAFWLCWCWEGRTLPSQWWWTSFLAPENPLTQKQPFLVFFFFVVVFWRFFNKVSRKRAKINCTKSISFAQRRIWFKFPMIQSAFRSPSSYLPDFATRSCSGVAYLHCVLGSLNETFPVVQFNVVDFELLWISLYNAWKVLRKVCADSTTQTRDKTKIALKMKTKDYTPKWISSFGTTAKSGFNATLQQCSSVYMST